MDTLKKILAPLASLRLTVVLLAAAMVLIFAGTLAQRTQGIWDVKAEYFSSWGLKVPVQNVLPFVQRTVPGWFPFIGGKGLIVLLLANLLTAHALRFKFKLGDLLLVPVVALGGVVGYFAQLDGNVWLLTLAGVIATAAVGLTAWLHGKRTGVIVIHFSLIMLLAGELITGAFAVESQMTIVQGDATNWSHDVRETELVVVDPSLSSEHDKVVAVPGKWLGQKSQIKDARLPFDVQVVKHYVNSELFERGQGDSLADSGRYTELKVQARPTVSGTQSEDVDRAAAFLKFTAGGQDLGTYLVTVSFGEPQKVKVGDKTYDVSLRFRRLHKPYTITLLKFSHDKYLGSDTPRNFSSRIRLVDPSRGVDREHLIRMNEPLRYRGETFYQQSFLKGDAGTVLQVVENPGLLLPYFACLLGAIGMVIHFGIVLVNFLRKQIKTNPGLIPFGGPAVAPTPPMAGRGPAGAKGSKGANGRKAAAGREGSYTLQPTRGWASWATLVPVAMALVGLAYVISHAAPHPYKKSTAGYDLESFAALPVSFDGRPMPVDSMARNSLKVLSGRESIKEGDRRVPAVEFLADVLAGNGRARDYKVFRIDHPQVKALLKLTPEDGPKVTEGGQQNPKFKEDDKLFSYNDILRDPGNDARLQRQIAQIEQVDEKQWDVYQKKVMQLYRNLGLYQRLAQLSVMPELYELLQDPKKVEELANQVQTIAATVKPEDLTEEHIRLIQRLRQIEGQVRWIRDAESDPKKAQILKKQDLYFSAPMKEGEDWQGLGQAVIGYRQAHTLPESAQAWMGILSALRDEKPAAFNEEVARYKRAVDAKPPRGAEKTGVEVYYNRFDPLFVTTWLYVGVFLFAAVSWLGFRRPLGRTAVVLALIALLVHTFGLVSRMYISGRPPVTNLYSSAVFIGFGAVILCLGLEALFRNAIGSAVAGMIGFATLWIAGGLAFSDATSRGQADTMGQLQAVLDTNFWLATHVVIITLGYAAAFLAGALATVYIVMGIVSTEMTAEVRKNLYRMVYGILCFAMLFSFVGTILGGIWADQSWGRFWGWDPKENGAILIVLIVALILHARWGGWAKERGVILLAIVGNIVTAWSWFGTNMLGVGLHAYGFMEHALFWLGLYVTSQLLLISAGNLPFTMWRSFRAEGDRASAPPKVPMAQRAVARV